MKRHKYCESLYRTENSYVFENFVSTINTTGRDVDVLTDAFYDMILPCIKVDFKKKEAIQDTRDFLEIGGSMTSVSVQKPRYMNWESL